MVLIICGSSSSFNSKHKRKLSFFRIQFYISVLLCIFCIICFSFYFFLSSQKEKQSKQLLNSFQIRTLYGTNETYSATILNTQEEKKEDSTFVIGIVEIDKLRLHYPILSETSNELLKISPCRFAGPLPNQVGNLCIAAHNYVDNKFFSRIHELGFGDIIRIYDLKGNKLEYVVDKQYEVSVSDTSCTNQETNGMKKITLLTCNNVKGTRVVVTAYEKKEHD